MEAFFLAHELGKDVEEVLEYPLELFAGWSAYFRIKAEEEAKAAKRSRTPKIQKSSGKGKSPPRAVMED